MLQVNRNKDRERALRFFEEYQINETKLQRILKDHDLMNSYNNFKNRK
jgi:hypothetical protein